MAHPHSITAVPLTPENYKPYGHVVAATVDPNVTTANQGTARRFNHLAEMQNLRTNAKLNFCVFRCQPRELPFEVKLLERHLYSTQSFIPMTCSKRYLVVVAHNNSKTNEPDLSTLRVFVAAANQGITYYPGIWHHPMIALDSVTDFSCLVYEDGTEDDCHVVPITPAVKLIVPLTASL